VTAVWSLPYVDDFAQRTADCRRCTLPSGRSGFGQYCFPLSADVGRSGEVVQYSKPEVHISIPNSRSRWIYEVHGTILATGAKYINRFCSIIKIENRKIAHWRDYMDSLAAWNALTAQSQS
jgi:hypothetical protein